MKTSSPRPLALLAVFLAALGALAGCTGGGPAPAPPEAVKASSSALQSGCGCTSTGKYVAPSLNAPGPATGLSVVAEPAAGGLAVTVRRSGNVVYTKTVPALDASTPSGFSPEGGFFLLASAAANARTLTLVDVRGTSGVEVWAKAVEAGPPLARFSALGSSLLVAYEAAAAPGQTQLFVVDGSSGDERFATSFGATLASAPTARWGFSSDDETLAYAFADGAATLSWNVVNLVEGARKVQRPGVKTISFWEFSRCGDAVALAQTDNGSDRKTADLYGTRDGNLLGGTSGAASAAGPIFSSTISMHIAWLGTSKTQVGVNNASKVCPEIALSGFTITPGSTTGGSRVKGKVSLSANAPVDTVVSLSSFARLVADTAVGSVTIVAGTPSVTFDIDTFAVTADTEVKFRARLGSNSERPAFLTVTKPDPRPVLSFTVTPALSVSGDALTATVVLEDGPGDTTVALTSLGDAVPGLPPSLAVNGGSTTGTFTFAAPEVTARKTFVLRAAVALSDGDTAQNAAFDVDPLDVVLP